ncbi:MAG TPA: ABC transporter permease [Lacunisphaera sp.]|jgi:sodium transport system permease protein
MINLKNILTVYLKELKDSLRDRRAIFSIVVVPTLLMPALMFGVGKIAAGIFSKARQETPTVMIIGGDDSPDIVAKLKQSEKMRIVESVADWKQRISDKKIRAAVQIPPGFEPKLKAGDAGPILIYNYGGELKSGFAAEVLEKFFRDLREKTVTDRLAARSLPPGLITPFEVKRENVAPPEKVGGNLLGGVVPYIVILLCFTGAMYPAMDLTAGEKERGTMETLLCSPVSRTNLVLGKFLVVLTGSLSAMVLSLASMGISATAAGLFFLNGHGGAGKLAAAHANAAASAMPTIDPLGLFGVIAMIFPVAILFSAVLFTISLFAKSYKEAQSYTAPMIFFVLMPAMVGMLPGVELNAGLALVPILNLSLVCKEMLSGIWHWNYIGLIFGSSCFYAAVALAFAVRMFNREDVIFRS